MYTAIILSAIIVAIIIVSLLLINNKYKNNVTNKIIKVLAVTYVVLTFFTILLPDGLIKSVSDPTELAGANKWHCILRIMLSINPIVIVAISFFKSRTFKNIAVYWTLPWTFISIFFYNDYMECFLSSSGRGLYQTRGISESFKALMMNETFRGIIFCIQWILVVSVCLKVLLIDKHVFRIKDYRETLRFGVILISLLLQMMPIYIPQLLAEGFGLFLFDKFSPLHIVWICYLVGKIVVLWLIFRNKSAEDKYLLCVVLALAVMFQYNSMFSLTINIKRLPLQLCNLASYLMLAALITKNRFIFNFNFLVNMVGASIALLVPDVNGRNIFEVWNLHFIYEHTNVVVVPILALLLGVFPKIDKVSYRDAVIGFSAYFVVILVLGIIFNNLAVKLDNNDFKANYLFMFDPEVACGTLPFLKAFTNVTLVVKDVTIYPFLMLFVYFGYLLIVSLVFLPFGIFQSVKNKKVKLDNVPNYA